jgi:hypothetical protein
MKQPVDHVLRPQLPWRVRASITECGLDASKVGTLTRGEFAERFKEMGYQRCALFTCMTCADTARRWGRWEDDPRKALEREITWETGWSRSHDRGDLLLDELTAIAALIALHPDEFTTLVAASTGRREWLAKKAAHAKDKKDG